MIVMFIYMMNLVMERRTHGNEQNTDYDPGIAFYLFLCNVPATGGNNGS
jgi:hypothetical protein